ncbi:retrovirus-related pol polyprotein from transposon TNT 1-94 [Tanacetum coccineum]
MLDRTDFESWQQRIRLYCLGKDNGENIMKSIKEGPFQMGTVSDVIAGGTEGAVQQGPVRARVLNDLSAEEKERYKADICATNILLQGIPKDIYSLINHYTDAKDIWENVKMILEGSELTKDDRESQLYDEFEHFCQIKGETIQGYYVRANHEVHANENRIMMERFGQPNNDPLALVSDASVQQYPTQSSKSPQPTKEPSPADNFQLDSGSSFFYRKLMIVNHTLALLHQSRESCGSKRCPWKYNATNQGKDHLSKQIQRKMVVAVMAKRLQDSTSSRTRATNASPSLEQYWMKNQSLFLAGEQVTNVDNDVDDSPENDLALNTMFMANLTSEDPIYDEAGPSYDSNNPFEHKGAIGYKNPVCLARAKQAQSALYNGHVLVTTNHTPTVIHDSEDTRELAEITRNKMLLKMQSPLCVENKVRIPPPPDYSKENFLATFAPQRNLTPEQIFWSIDDNNRKKAETLAPKPISALTVYPPNTPVKLVPRILPTKKVVSLYNAVDVTALIEQMIAIESNAPLKQSGSKPRSNTMKNRILPLLEENKKGSRVIQVMLWYLDSGCSKHMTGNRSKLINYVEKFIGLVRFGNDHLGAIMGYGDYVMGDSVISRVYYVEGLGHNLFSVGQFCDSDLEVAFRKHTCFVRDIKGTNILKGSRGTNLYTISIDEMMKSSPICLLSKASKSKSWLWHRRLNHLNFGTINDLARKDLVRGLPRLKFEKDHLCSACQLGKSKKFSHRPKSENTNMEVLHTLHMDLCGPMRVQSIKGKKYILVIVDDYSRFTWVKFLRSKDETPEFVTNFLKQIQVGLNKTVRFIRTDNGTEFVNQVMSEYYEGVGIFHQKSVPRTPQQNGVVERRNRTLVEAARTMMIFSKAPMFLWAEAVATACYTQNRSLIHTRHNKTPYELVHDKKPDLTFFRVFGALCYPANDSENLGKFQAKADIGIFVGYAPSRKGYRIYNKRTRRLMETIHVTFDEMHQSMAPVQ